MKLKRLFEAIPYKGEAFEIYDKITRNRPNPYDEYRLYRLDADFDDGMYYEARGFLHIVQFNRCTVDGFKKGLGFTKSLLKKNGMLSNDSFDYIWGKTIPEFKEVLSSQSDAEKFVKRVYDDIEGIDVRDDQLPEIIEDIFKEYR